MSVKELIVQWLREAGKEKRAAQLERELDEDNRFLSAEVGADVDSGPIRYVERWGNEGSFVSLFCERE